MDLYFSPLSCSLASRISIYEAGIEDSVRFHNVSLQDKRVDGTGNYYDVTAKGRVPSIVTKDGQLLTENAAVLQYIADRAPDCGLAPVAGSFERSEVQQWLSYVGTELHKYVFAVQFTPDAPEDVRAYALQSLLPARFDFVDKTLGDGRAWLTGAEFTVADAYLFAITNWAFHLQIDMTPWPNFTAWHGRTAQRPAVARAMQEELALSQAA